MTSRIDAIRRGLRTSPLPAGLGDLAPAIARAIEEGLAWKPAPGASPGSGPDRMHYWPRGASGAAPFACSAHEGLRGSAIESVTCPDCLGHLALLDRRQRALEAYWDAPRPNGEPDVTVAIETATRVRVDHEVMATVFPLIENKLGLHDAETIIAAAFRAAGFEVEQ